MVMVNKGIGMLAGTIEGYDTSEISYAYKWNQVKSQLKS